jgi:hypothetical protein
MWQIQQLGKSLVNSIFSSCQKNWMDGWMDGWTDLTKTNPPKTIASYQKTEENTF